MIVSPDNYRIIRGEYVYDSTTEPQVWQKAYAAVRECAERYSTLVVLVGLPRSGKSHWARANDTDSLCIFDATSTSVARRKALLDLLPEGGEAVSVLFDTSFAVCLERNKLRPRGPLPVEVMDRMRSNLVPPTRNEGFARTIVVPHLAL